MIGFFLILLLTFKIVPKDNTVISLCYCIDSKHPVNDIKKECESYVDLTAITLLNSEKL